MQQVRLSKAPLRSEGKSSRVVRTGNITNSIVVIGDNNRLSINQEGNAIVDRLAANQHPIVKRRIPDQKTLDRQVKAWTKERNRNVVKVDWRFTTTDARIKLKHLYPKIQT
jgi:hypothetical protein